MCTTALGTSQQAFHLSSFSILKETELDTPTGYAKKWAKQMSEAYKIASENSRQSSARGKTLHDKRGCGVKAW